MLAYALRSAADPVALWSGGALPTAAEASVLTGATFHVIKRYEPETDGYFWLHGVALAWHKGRLFASFGHNMGSENTATEEARWRVSDDGGATWGAVQTIDPGAGDLGVSHGVLLSHGGTLWAFQGAFSNDFSMTHARAYTLDEAVGQWLPLGVVVGEGFWPMQEPQRMCDGNWLMSGIRVAKGLGVTGNLPAVAISHGDDLTRWDLVAIPCDAGVTVSSVWGESTVMIDGATLWNVSRWGGSTLALAACSADCGRTWSPARASNLPMAASKPYTGTLSTGQRYLVCTTLADTGNRRYPLTLAVSAPGRTAFSRVFVIRHALFPEGPGESHASAALSYPFAVEHDGGLYVGYSNSGGRGGNRNSGELAVIPLSALDLTREETRFVASEDNFMYSSSASGWWNRNWGKWTTPQLGIGLNNTAKDTYRALLRFTLTNLNLRARTVTAATLTLTQASNGKIVPANGAFETRLFLLDESNAEWIEGTNSAALASPEESCWNWRRYDTAAWSGGPGIGNGAALPGIASLLAAAAIDADTIAVGTPVTFRIDSPDGLAALEKWARGGSNAGFLLATDEVSGGQNALLVASREHGTAAWRPTLTVVTEPKTETGTRLLLF
jgi:hypothetical protein